MPAQTYGKAAPRVGRTAGGIVRTAMGSRVLSKRPAKGKVKSKAKRTGFPY